MSSEGLSDLLARLTTSREVVRIVAEVSPDEELAAITRRVSAEVGPRMARPELAQRTEFPATPVLVFERVTGSSLPVVTNLWGTPRRLFQTLGDESPKSLAERLRSELSGRVAEGWWEQLRTVPQMAQGGRFAPKVVRSGACQQVVRLGRDVTLEVLPFLRQGTLDTAPSLLSGVVFTKDPGTGLRDAARVCVVRESASTCRLVWSIHDVGYQNFLGYQERSLRMPVAVVVGGDPAVMLAAATPPLPGFDPLRVAGFLRGGPVELVACRTQDLEIPAGAEVVLEGYLDPGEPWEPVGTIPSASGHYRTEGLAPRLHVSAVTQRANPQWLAEVVGGGVTAGESLGEFMAVLGLPLLQRLLPEVVDLALPASGLSGAVAFVSIRKQYPWQARRVIQQLTACSPHWPVKWVVVVDHDVDLRRPERVWQAVASQSHAPRDLHQITGPGSQLDHASPDPGLTAMVGIDATRKLPGEGHPRAWPEGVESDAGLVTRVNQRWAELGLE